MNTWLKLGIRNLFRNQRRSLFTILAIGLGFASVNALGGFTAYIFTSLEDSYIHGQANGHLSIFKAGFLREGKLNPNEFLLSSPEIKEVETVLHDGPGAIRRRSNSQPLQSAGRQDRVLHGQTAAG